ncbi:hypothetical protein D3C87_1022850 [compost metagenome]
MIPLNELNTESKINACNGASASPTGAGTLSTIACKISGIPIPVLPEAGIISSRSQPIKSIIWSLTSSGIAPGKSILFKIGIISRSCSKARYKFEMVWACIPCEASTISKAPSQAAIERETS